LIVVSNSSPIMNLVAIGRLNLIKHKFGKVVIPDAVWRELVIDGKGKKGVEDIEKSDWIKVQPVRDKALVKVLAKDIDSGESEAIALAVENNADVLLLDDKAARLIAANLGLKLIGVVGILIWAKKEGIIKQFSKELDKLREEANFRMSEDLIKRALQEVEETY
jgi:predicted nucleic acid-binding protein